jgi:hypothetical protein
MPYAITHKPTDAICQCGALVKFSYFFYFLIFLFSYAKTPAYSETSKRCCPGVKI